MFYSLYHCRGTVSQGPCLIINIDVDGKTLEYRKHFEMQEKIKTYKEENL